MEPTTNNNNETIYESGVNKRKATTLIYNTNKRQNVILNPAKFSVVKLENVNILQIFNDHQKAMLMQAQAQERSLTEPSTEAQTPMQNSILPIENLNFPAQNEFLQAGMISGINYKCTILPTQSLLTNDDKLEEKTIKLEEKKEKNKIAAAKFRKKKQDMFNAMKARVAHLEAENNCFRNILARHLAENECKVSGILIHNINTPGPANAET